MLCENRIKCMRRERTPESIRKCVCVERADCWRVEVFSGSSSVEKSGKALDRKLCEPHRIKCSQFVRNMPDIGEVGLQNVHKVNISTENTLYEGLGFGNDSPFAWSKQGNMVRNESKRQARVNAPGKPSRRNEKRGNTWRRNQTHITQHLSSVGPLQGTRISDDWARCSTPVISGWLVRADQLYIGKWAALSSRSQENW